MKMNEVRDNRRLKPITVIDCENGYEGQYRCISENCHAQMSFVLSHQRRVHEKVITVNSFFKLKKNQQHDKSCPYDPLGAIQLIVRESNCDELKALEDKKYTFSLQLLHQPKIQKPSETNNAPSNATKKDKMTTSTHYIREGTAPTYLKALTQILKLRNKVEESDKLASILTLTYKKTK